MSTEGTKHGLNTDGFYEAIMTEKVEFITKPENRPLVCLPLNNVKRIIFSYQVIVFNLDLDVIECCAKLSVSV